MVNQSEFILLTHPREKDKPTNTGKLVLDSLACVTKRVEWSRTEPNSELLRVIANTPVALLYPSESSKPLLSSNEYRTFVILDATWQEANKIYNRSPYLHALPQVHLPNPKSSRFHLRRNQRQNGLCTAESVIEVLRVTSQEEQANHLEHRFANFINNYGKSINIPKAIEF